MRPISSMFKVGLVLDFFWHLVTFKWKSWPSPPKEIFLRNKSRLKCEKKNLFLDLPIRAKDICPTWRNTVFTKFVLWTLSPFFEKNYYFKCCSFELAIQKRAKQLINKCKSLASSDPFMKISGCLSLKNLEPDVL